MKVSRCVQSRGGDGDRGDLDLDLDSNLDRGPARRLGEILLLGDFEIDTTRSITIGEGDLSLSLGIGSY